MAAAHLGSSSTSIFGRGRARWRRCAEKKRGAGGGCKNQAGGSHASRAFDLHRRRYAPPSFFSSIGARRQGYSRAEEQEEEGGGGGKDGGVRGWGREEIGDLGFYFSPESHPRTTRPPGALSSCALERGALKRCRPRGRSRSTVDGGRAPRGGVPAPGTRLPSLAALPPSSGTRSKRLLLPSTMAVPSVRFSAPQGRGQAMTPRYCGRGGKPGRCEREKRRRRPRARKMGEVSIWGRRGARLGFHPALDLSRPRVRANIERRRRVGLVG